MLTQQYFRMYGEMKETQVEKSFLQIKMKRGYRDGLKHEKRKKLESTKVQTLGELGMHGSAN